MYRNKDSSNDYCFIARVIKPRIKSKKKIMYISVLKALEIMKTDKL